MQAAGAWCLHPALTLQAGLQPASCFGCPRALPSLAPAPGASELLQAQSYAAGKGPAPEKPS